MCVICARKLYAVHKFLSHVFWFKLFFPFVRLKLQCVSVRPSITMTSNPCHQIDFIDVLLVTEQNIHPERSERERDRVRCTIWKHIEWYHIYRIHFFIAICFDVMNIRLTSDFMWYKFEQNRLLCVLISNHIKYVNSINESILIDILWL